MQRKKVYSFDLLTNPTEIIADENGWVKAVKCVRMELGEPDASGRRRPVVIEGSEFEMEADTCDHVSGNFSKPVDFFYYNRSGYRTEENVSLLMKRQGQLPKKAYTPAEMPLPELLPLFWLWVQVKRQRRELTSLFVIRQNNNRT